MRLVSHYHGRNDPFEGDLTLWLRNLPDGVRVTKATITLTSVNSPAAPTTLFQESFTFPSDMLNTGELCADAWGVTRTESDSFVGVDFHARRTLARVAGSGGAATLQVALGGAYVSVAEDGTCHPDKPAWEVNLSNESPLPGLTVNKFRLIRTPENPDILKLTRVSLRLGQMPPFWTHAGELATAQTSPDFADRIEVSAPLHLSRPMMLFLK